VVLNGGLRDPESARAALRWADGVMIGREAYTHPWSLRGFEAAVLGRVGTLDRDGVLAAYLDYVERQRARGVALPTLVKPLLGLFNGAPGARRFRQILSEDARRPDAGPELIAHAARAIGARRAA
jgi:tRNA-dihydrouridine synthase A